MSNSNLEPTLVVESPSNSSNVSVFEQDSALRVEPLKFWEGVALIFGANIGAGILGLAYGSRLAGWPILLFALVLTGTLTTISMLYVAETTLRTKKPLQLAGLAEKYIGNVGSWLIFLSVAINTYGCLIAYMAGSGRILGEFLGVAPHIGSLIFFIPATIIVWLGLRVTGIAEKFITSGMVALILILILATITGPGVKAEHLAYANWAFAIPVLNIAIFCYISQYLVPELTRGFSHKDSDIKLLPKAIVTGMFGTGLFLALVPMAAIGMAGVNNVTEVVTTGWGEKLGSWAYVTANTFAILAMMTSFWAVGETFLTNIVDKMKFKSEWDIKTRIIAISIVVIPPFILAYKNILGFVDAIGYSGAFAGVIMSILPVMMLRESRKNGEIEPAWTVGKLAHPAIQTLIIIVFSIGAIYAVLGYLGALPKGW